ncbi:hypothetical protein ACOSP7_004746 [Xanthoceras sorbifolium]
MLKAGQPRTLAPASLQTTPAAKDASKPAKNKQKVAEESSSGVEIFLPAGVTAFNDYKSLIRGADQFLLPRDVQLLKDSSVSTTVDRGLLVPSKNVMQEKDARIEDLDRRVTKLSANKRQASNGAQGGGPESLRPNQRFDDEVREYSG